MADPTVPQVVRSYLAQLERALADLPAGVRDEIVAGIQEELEGLDAGAAAARIEEFGDPEFIAAEARTEAATAAPAGTTPQVDTHRREPRWYPVLAALLVAFGGVIVPVVGWVVGLALMWMSTTWRRRDKWVATLTPFVVFGGFVLVFALTSMASESNGPSTSDVGNPLIPGIYSAVWSGVVLVIPVNAVVGIWLLWRAKRGRFSGDPSREAAGGLERTAAVHDR